MATKKGVTKTLTFQAIEFKKAKKLIEKRIGQVSDIRDALRADKEELEGLEGSCEEALLDLEHAIDALSQLA